MFVASDHERTQCRVVERVWKEVTRRALPVAFVDDSNRPKEKDARVAVHGSIWMGSCDRKGRTKGRAWSDVTIIAKI